MLLNLLRPAWPWLLLGAAACAPAPYRYQPAGALAVGGADATPQLLFVSFRMTATGPRRLELLRAQAVPGEVSALATAEEIGPAYLLLTQLDAQGRPCGPPTPAPHPLLRDVEAPGEGTAMVRRRVSLPEAEFFVRLARQPRAQALRVQEQGTGLAAPLSVSFPLTF